MCAVTALLVGVCSASFAMGPHIQRRAAAHCKLMARAEKVLAVQPPFALTRASSTLATDFSGKAASVWAANSGSCHVRCRPAGAAACCVCCACCAGSHACCWDGGGGL